MINRDSDIRFERIGACGASSSSRMPCPQPWFSPIERLVRDPHFSSFGLHRRVLDQPIDDYNQWIYYNVHIHKYGVNRYSTNTDVSFTIFDGQLRYIYCSLMFTVFRRCGGWRCRRGRANETDRGDEKINA